MRRKYGSPYVIEVYCSIRSAYFAAGKGKKKIITLRRYQAMSRIVKNQRIRKHRPLPQTGSRSSATVEGCSTTIHRSAGTPQIDGSITSSAISRKLFFTDGRDSRLLNS